MHPLDREATRLSQQQHGVFTDAQVAPYGTRRQINRRVKSGRWISFGRGVYAIAGTPITGLQRYKAAELSMPRAAISGPAAVWLHNSRRGPAPEPEISVRPPGTHEHPFAKVRRRHDIRTVRVDGIRTTTIPQTIADLVGILPVRAIEDMIDTEVINGRASVEALENRRDAMQRHHLPYRRVFADILADRARTLDLATSVLEARLIDILRTLDLPGWSPQFPLPWWQGGSGRGDVAIPAWRIIIEADGRQWHTRLGDFERDRRRDQLAAANGWLVLRFSWNEIVHDVDHVVGIILAAGAHRVAA